MHTPSRWLELPQRQRPGRLPRRALSRHAPMLSRPIMGHRTIPNQQLVEHRHTTNMRGVHPVTNPHERRVPIPCRTCAIQSRRASTLARLVKLKGNMNTADLIQRLIEKANYHDTFGHTDEGNILREAAAALAEAKNENVIRGMIHQILEG